MSGITSSNGYSYPNFPIIDLQISPESNKKDPAQDATSLSLTNPTLENDESQNETLLAKQSFNKLKIEEALGGTEDAHTAKFQAKFKVSITILVIKILEKLVKIRQSGADIGYSGFIEADLKRWVFVVKLDADDKIEKIFIGRFLAEGSSTKTYLTMNQKVLLVPIEGEKATEKTLNAYKNIQYLRSESEKPEEFTKSLSELLHEMHFTPYDLQQVLPPLPIMFPIETRPILVAPEATCADKVFGKSPQSLADLINRIKIIRDVAFGVAYNHEIGLIHGDIKSENILINAEGRGMLHDLAGSQIFTSKDSNKEALNKYYNLTTTTRYYHHEDLKTSYHYRINPDINKVFNLACKRDVFALSVTALEACIGMYDAEGYDVLPFPDEYYYEVKSKGSYFPKGLASARKEISSFALFPLPDIAKKFQALFDQTLQPTHKDRLTAKQFALGINELYMELSKPQ